MFFKLTINAFVYKFRDIMLAFLNQVQQDELAACPLGLYKVTPSILLTILSLILSYVIVLIQTK